ncbi:hypothetical protein CDL12_20375 [Handroanthus impetiginosus]|uniref:Uncharacterized protein n=1 Tax=Handroanthus impetiginosus TaxID=429701 RepID=A0A2G9GP61_9LAMI|nr:hypothetical protein CDL12_20375 [Handroanthus impetiginosus]
MEIPAWIFFSFWALTGAGSLFLGIEALDKTGLPNSISPVIMSLFRHFLAISVCHSSTYALVFRPKLNISVEKYYLWASFAVFPVIFSRMADESFAWYFPIYSLINLFVLLRYFLPEMNGYFFEDYLYKRSAVIAFFPLLYFFSRGESFGWYFSLYISNFMIIFQFFFLAASEENMGLFIHFAAMSSLFLIRGKTKYHFPILVLFFSFLTSVAQAAISGDERFQKWLPAAAAGENRIVLELKKLIKRYGKVIEFAIGIGGTIIFQNFFRLTSFDHVVAFLYFTVAWLANLVLLLLNHDLGIFNFFLSNVIVGCTVSQFGLRGTTWVVYGASVLLYSLRLKLVALSLVTRAQNEAVLLVWRD